jgi:nucleoside 2-deoxyribosyltransferase
MNDYSNEPEFREWAKRVRTELIPKLEDSALNVSLVPADGTDVKFAVELGFSIMLDKPIIAVVEPGSKVPEKLVRVADRIVEADLHSKDGQAKVHQSIEAALADLERDGP